MTKTLKRKVVVGLFWSFLGQSGYLLISLITNIILARILGPEAFGQIGIIMFFIVIAKVFTESGLSGALVRKKDVSEEDFSTVFIFNLGISILVFILFVLMADFISQFYEDKLLKKLLIVSSLVLIINAFQIVNNTRLIYTLNYRKKSIIEFIAVSIASITSIILASLFNAGVWAVVALQLLTATLITIQLWLYLGPLKTLVFRIDSFKSLYKFGIYTTLSSLINTAFDNVYQLVLGKYFSVKQTGLFYQAKKLQEIPIGVIQSTTHGVLFIALAKVQDDEKQFSSLYVRIITLFTIAVGFICLFIYFYAENIILLFYGKEWIEAVFYMQILIIASFFYMQEMFNRIIFKVFDRTEKILYLEIIKKTFQAVTIFVGMLMQRIDVLLYGFLLTSFLSYFINYYYSRKVFGGFSWYEILTVSKVFIIGFCTVLIGIYLKSAIQIHGFYTFLLFPILLMLYISLIQVTKVSNLITDLTYFRNLIINNDDKANS